MRHFTAIWIAAVLLSGCARAQAPSTMPLAAPVPASTSRPMAAIDDTEPDVTQQVALLLVQAGANALPQDRLTDNASAALGVAQMQQMSAALRQCGNRPALQLLARTTKGEDRNYLYRALCSTKPLLVEINFNKAARISHLAVRPEP